MTLDFDLAIIFIAIVPFLAAIFAPVITRETGRAAAWILAIIPAGLFVCLCTMLPAIADGQVISASFDWVPALALKFSIRVDGLSLVFAILISGIGALVLLYSGSYLKDHPHLGRFNAFLLLFMGAMLGLVLVDNLVALFAFWELTSVTSFLLIGFDHEREAARRAAIQALIVTGVGGLALLAGGVLMAQIGESWDLSALSGEVLKASPLYPAILVLVLLAAFTKSAQFPFHFWLPNAMEAPTPVSAYLHSATMVQAGIYLLARLSPQLGATPLWHIALIGFGGFTLLWGAVAALRQTDLKQMLAQSTIAALGLLVLLLGLGGEWALTAAVTYFVAHALYKAGLFLVLGLIDHQTGTRDIDALGGLRDQLTIAFLAALLCGFSMFGMPAFLGFIAKEAIYAAFTGAGSLELVILAVLVIGNALLGAIGLLLALQPFLGALKPTPRAAGEGPFTMLVGPVLLGIIGLVAGFAGAVLAPLLFTPMVDAISGYRPPSHTAPYVPGFSLPFWLSLLTWGIDILIFWRARALRLALNRFGRTGAFDRAFDALMFGLIRFAGAFTRFWHHGKLELYLLVLFVMLAAALFVPPWLLRSWPQVPAFPEMAFYEWAVVGLAIIGIGAVVLARTRLFAIIALGVQGLAVALLFVLFGAPDLAFTQFMVEILSVVILALVMTRLRLDARDPRPFEDLFRDGGLALLCGAGFALLLLRILEAPFDARVSAFYTAASVVLAHGHNIVNVILVDFRGLDTLGEIAVVMTAGIAILALLRTPRKAKVAAVSDPSPKPPRKPRQRQPRQDGGAAPT